jgi:hypothetical protein
MMNAKLNAIKPISTIAIFVALVVWVSLCLIALLGVVNLISEMLKEASPSTVRMM